MKKTETNVHPVLLSSLFTYCLQVQITFSSINYKKKKKKKYPKYKKNYIFFKI